MYKAIVFDFGNTLAQSASLAEALKAVVDVDKAIVIGESIEAEIAALYKPDQQEQPDWKVIWDRCFAAAGLAFQEELGRQHLERFCSLNQTFQGIPELLSELKHRGMKLGLLSNVTGPYEIFQKDLEHRGLAKYFDAIVWSSAIGYRKPCSLAFEAVLAKLGVDPKEALMVGDSEIADIEGAAKVGMATVWVTSQPNKHTADYSTCPQRLATDVLSIAGAARLK